MTSTVSVTEAPFVKKDSSSHKLAFSSNGEPPEIRRAKQAAAEAAAARIQSGMLVGLGTGSTALYFLQALGKRCQQGMQINAVPSSQRTREVALQAGIPLIEIDEVSFLDVTVDGADEIDSDGQMIKGGGGALLREKIIASSSEEMIVIVDSHKCVKTLGHHALPVEIVRFGSAATLAKLERLGYSGSLRRTSEDDFYITENGNLIVDIDIRSQHSSRSPREIDLSVRSIVGVVETGFFFDLAHTVIVGFEDGHIEVRAQR